MSDSVLAVPVLEAPQAGFAWAVARQVVRTVAKAYGMSPSVMFGERRRSTKTVCEARYICGYLLRAMTHLSYPEIGELFAFHHTTVLYGVKKIERQLEESIPWQNRVNSLRTATLAALDIHRPD